MWYEKFPPGTSWTHLWSEYVLCSCCAIRKIGLPCPLCEVLPSDIRAHSAFDFNGKRYEVPIVLMGAEGRYEDYEFLALMEREWKRPLSSGQKHSFGSKLSERCNVVLLFWTYFETRMNRLVAIGMRKLPKSVQDDLLRRYDSVTSHMGPLYKILYGVSYIDDLIEVGAESIGGHLGRVKDCRNKFVHGEPTAISDDLVQAVVRLLKEEHDAWVAVYNRRLSLSK